MKEKVAVDGVLACRVPLEGWVLLSRGAGWEGRWQKAADYGQLVKWRLSLLVLVTALIGFFLASQGPVPFGLLVGFAAGQFLVVAGANALNEIIERDRDALMRRTADRPLPAGRMGVGEAVAAAALMSAAGGLWLALAVNGLTALLAALAWAIYVLAYTPLKRKSVWCTFVGAVSGAIPPVMGWTAARNEIGALAGVLFTILFLWQFPHFWAIAWIYREDYAQAGYQILPVIDPTGQRTGRQVLLSCLLLWIVSLIPAGLLADPVYFFGALGLGLVLTSCGARLWAMRSRSAARQLMLASILYLPALLMLLLLSKK